MSDRGYALVILGAGFGDDVFMGVRDACLERDLRVYTAGARQNVLSYWENSYDVNITLPPTVDDTAKRLGSDLRVVVALRGTGNKSVRVQAYIESALARNVYTVLPGRATCYIPDRFEAKVTNHPMVRDRVEAALPWDGVMDPSKKVITYKLPPVEMFESSYRAGVNAIELLFFYRDSRGKKFIDIPLEIAIALEEPIKKKRGRPPKNKL